MPFVAPEVVTPAPYEVSFGRIAGRASPATARIVVSIDGRVRAEKPIARPRFDFWIALPQRDVRVTVIAVDQRGRRAATAVEPVFGLPRASAPRGPPRRSFRDTRLARELRALGREFPGICGILVEDLRDGARAAWNVRAHFPAASTLKVAIAVEVLRVLRGKPWRGSRVDRLLRRMLIPSDDKAANELLIWLGGTISGGAARVNSTLQALALYDTDMYGGYLVQANEPSFVGKRTTASDYASLLRQIHFAAEGKGRLARRFRGSFIPADARHLLYLLAHTTTGWLDRFLSAGQATVVQKAGWITRARHDGGLVYWPGGTFVAVVLTWNERGVGAASDVLAGRVARAALARLSRKG